MEDAAQCMLVVIGATKSGDKELLALVDGYRESEQSWLEALNDLKRRGLKTGPKVAVGDGALGFWKALPQAFGETRNQRCWMHKTGNVLDKLPKNIQPRAKENLHQIWMAETKENAEKAFDHFIASYEAKYPKATECLAKDRKVLLTFYDFPGRTLAAFENDESDRVYVCDGSAPHNKNSWYADSRHYVDDWFSNYR